MAEKLSNTIDVPLNNSGKSSNINENSTKTSESYFPIHPMVLRIDTVFSFNVYIRTQQDHYEIFHTAGEAYTAYIHGGIFKYSLSKLYVKDSDKHYYFNYLENFFIIIINDPLINILRKTQISHELVSHLAMIVCENPKAEIIIRYKNVIKPISEFIIKQKDAIYQLISMTKSSYNDYNHLVNVGIYGMGLAKEVLAKDVNFDMSEIAAGFFLHDIGICNIPKHIYHKQGSLTDEEWIIMKKHPQEGYNMLKKLNILTGEAQIIILQHHERHDGKGYPSGLKGNQIHTYSKICSIADTFDALTSYRPFRKAKKSFEALKIMHTEMKNEFDPKFFGRFVLLFSKSKNVEKT